jgi:hypothetical protein
MSNNPPELTLFGEIQTFRYEALIDSSRRQSLSHRCALGCRCLQSGTKDFHLILHRGMRSDGGMALLR